ncbi:MAG: AlpA family phage regulatory protein [Acidovorax sp.]|uniref:helix-turn-helix transcriptional regulator n=1 Tax=Acidovorax sp. TaxID=1872122 RepID=UPI0026384AD5|nr:AlpA family phage regulatory protein [Acidovorax sp.]MDH4466153.1 AlpA family phage regulatory protein [Acidovorax sp.]
MQIKRTIRRPELLAKTGLSKTSIYNLEKSGDFPAHFMLTPRCAVWDEAEVDAWLEGRRVAPAVATAAPDQTQRTRFPGRGKAKTVTEVLA